MGAMAFCVLFLLLLSVNIKADDCADCEIFVGGGTLNAGYMYPRWAVSYQILQPKFSLQYISGTNPDAIAKLLTPCKTGYIYDYAAIASSPVTAGFVTDDNNLVTFPFYLFAVTMIYNIPGINPASDQALALTQEVIYKIFNLHILYWDDPEIVSVNQNLAAKLPHEKIKLVVRTDVGAPPTKALTVTFTRFNSSYWTTVGRTDWPAEVLASPNTIAAPNPFSVPSNVVTIPYSIGYSAKYYATLGGLSTATVFNKKGVPVDATTESLQAAISDVWGGEKGYNFSNDPFDVGDQLGDNSYPYTLVSYIVLQKVRNLECSARRELFKFLNWAYTDKKAIGQMSGTNGDFSPLTAEHSQWVIDQLKTFTCQNEPLLRESIQDTSIVHEREAVMVVASALIAFSLTTMTALVYTRNSRITKAAGLAFTGCFLLGCILNYVAIFFWALSPESNIICQSRYVFVALGETLILGAMFSKCWEINKIFQRVEKGDISPFQEIPWWKFCRVFFLLLITQLIILAILMGVDYPRTLTTLYDPINLIGKHECILHVSGVWLGLEGTFFTVLLVWGAYLAYQTRTVWARYNYPNESRSILFSIYNTVGAIVLLIPLLALLTYDEDTTFILVSVAIAYPTTFSISMVYLPKLVTFLAGSKSSRAHSKDSKGSKGSKRGGVGSHKTGWTHEHDHDSRTIKPLSKIQEQESHAKMEKSFVEQTDRDCNHFYAQVCLRCWQVQKKIKHTGVCELDTLVCLTCKIIESNISVGAVPRTPSLPPPTPLNLRARKLTASYSPSITSSTPPPTLGNSWRVLVNPNVTNIEPTGGIYDNPEL